MPIQLFHGMLGGL